MTLRFQDQFPELPRKSWSEKDRGNGSGGCGGGDPGRDRRKQKDILSALMKGMLHMYSLIFIPRQNREVSGIILTQLSCRLRFRDVPLVRDVEELEPRLA